MLMLNILPAMLNSRQTARLAVLLILTGVALHAHALKWGFLYDDFMHQAVLRYGERFPEISGWNLYDYGVRPEQGQALYEAGLYPWWTAADFSVRFLRPVASASILLDHALYGAWAPGYHVTNLLIFSALLTAAFFLFRALGAPRRAALWALAFLACEDVLALPVGWIANRNAVMSGLFTAMVLLCVQRFRRKGSVKALAAGVICFFLACGSKESGLLGLPLVGLYLLLFDAGAGENFFRGCWRVMRSGVVWIFAAAAFVYLSLYAAGGYGTTSRLYTTLWGEPAVYLERLAVLIPVALTGLFFGVPADMVFARPQVALRILAFGLPALAALAFLFLRVLKGNRVALFAAAWAVLGLIPVAGVTTGDRLLVNACIGTSLLLGLLVDGLGGLCESVTERRYGRVAVVVFFLLVGIVFSAPLIRLRGAVFYKLAASDRQAVTDAEIDPESAKPEHVFVLSVPGPFFALTMLPTWTVIHDDPSRAINYFQMARRPLELRRDGERGMVVTYCEQGLLSNRYEMLFQTTEKPLEPGSVFRMAQYVATVLESGPGGISRVRFDFDRPLEDGSYAFMAWREGRLRRIDLPPVGGTLELEAAIPAVPYAP